MLPGGQLDFIFRGNFVPGGRRLEGTKPENDSDN